MEGTQDRKEGRKDASYFLGHMNNLPEPRARALRELEAECASRRMLALTVGEAMKRLGLATAEQDYMADPLSELSALRRYLLTSRVSFAPCGNPADVAFNDPLFLTPMPVLTNDEDISAVARLAKSHRAPAPSDYGAISRTTSKMNGYNVMLRVFENLCAVRSGQLGAAQLDTLNRILGSLVLPLEGENYLRVCLSYASLVGVKHCDYGRCDTLYPKLSEKLMEQVDECLARVCAASSYPQPIDQRYPRFEKLAEQCSRFRHVAREEAASDPDELEREATMSFNRSRIPSFTRYQAQAASEVQLPSGEGGALFSRTDLKVSPGTTGDKLREARGRISLLERVRLSIPSVRKNLRERLRFAEGRIMQGLPMPGRIWVEVSPMCRERLVIRGDAAEGSLLSFGIIPRGMDPIEYCRRDTRPWGLLQYLQGAEPESTAQFEAMREITASTLFYALIAAPLLGGEDAFNGVAPESIARAAADGFLKSLEVPHSDQRTELGALYALHRTLVAPRPLEEEASDMALMRALHACPGVLNAYVQDRLARADFKGGECPAVLRIPCMLAGLSEILRTSKTLSFLLSRAPGRPEFFTYCEKAFARMGYFHGMFSLEDGPERRLDFEGMPEPLLKLGRIPLAAFVMKQIASRRGFNDLSGKCLRVDTGFSLVMEKELRARTDALEYLSASSPLLPDTVSRALCGTLSKTQALSLRHALSQVAADGQARLGGALRGADRVLGTVLEGAGLLSVPDPALPHEIWRSVRWSAFCPASPDLMEDQDARERFAAAQCALFMFMTIAPASRRSAALVPMLEAPEADQPALARALEDLEGHCRALVPKTPGQIRALNLRRLGPSFNGFFQRCLKKLVSIEMAHSVFASYERTRFDEMLGCLGIREAVLPPAGARRGGASAFDSLDKELIRKRVSETREVEAAISRIRDEEEEGAREDGEQPEKAPRATGKKAEPARPQAQEPAPSAPDASALPGLSSQALELFRSVAAQNADAIDAREFEGLCRSHGYMSGDAAIEELNGWCFDNLDEGVFESAPEDGCVYVSTDILSQIVKG